MIKTLFPIMSIVFQSGNAGPFDIQLGFKPPKGVGLSVDCGVVKGGGAGSVVDP